MNILRKTRLTALAFLLMGCGLSHAAVPPYKNHRLSVDERVEDLLARMTLEEKVGQMLCMLGWNSYVRTNNKVVLSEQFKHEVDHYHVGGYWGVFRADPWTQKTFDNGLNPPLAAHLANLMQRYAIEKTRLGIPLFLAEEAPHGHMAIGATVFPTGYGLSATFDTGLMEQVGKAVAEEIRTQGAHISYGPVMDLARDPRWSRVEETLGEDPVLCGGMAAALTRGFGGGRLENPLATIVTPKHFIAYGVTEGGHNGDITHIGQHELHESFLPPFRRVVEAGARSLMTSYNSLDGIPSTANKRLLTDLLHKEWGFDGFVVSDLYSINGLRSSHHVAQTDQDAAVMAASAGVDVDLGALAYAHLVEAVRQQRLDTAVVNQAVRRVLSLKFEMGLFDHPYVDEDQVSHSVRTPEHVALARKAAQESVTLLKNDHGLLPLSKDIKVAVVGPNADNCYNLLGDYTAPQDEQHVTTVLEGIRMKLPSEQVVYVRGCAVRDTTEHQLEEAVAAAREADVVIAVVGGSSARDFKTSYEQTGAAVQTRVSDMDCGEGFDRATLSLMGLQDKLLQAVHATGKPLVVVYIEGRPLNKNWAVGHAGALLTAYYPGQEGGAAIADVLFGDYNPAGRLSVSIPRSEGQLPVYYNKQQPARRDYIDEQATPLFAFGFGLSYTQFQYSHLSVTARDNLHYDVTFDIANVGTMAGDEVPQLYIRDEVASAVSLVMQLRHFTRVHIPAGETRMVTFHIGPEDLQTVTPDLQRLVEPGEFTLMVGSSSDRILLEQKIFVE